MGQLSSKKKDRVPGKKDQGSSVSSSSCISGNTVSPSSRVSGFSSPDLDKVNECKNNPGYPSRRLHLENERGWSSLLTPLVADSVSDSEPLDIHNEKSAGTVLSALLSPLSLNLSPSSSINPEVVSPSNLDSDIISIDSQDDIIGCESTDESLAEDQLIGTSSSSPDGELILTVEAPKKNALPLTPTVPARLPKPSTVSFYIPRQTRPPNTKDATKKTLSSHQRIRNIHKSKLLSNVVSESATRKLNKLMNVWASIKNLTNTDSLKAVKRLELPILMNFKLIELKRSFADLVASVSDFESCSILFDILGDISFSKLDYHKTEVMKEVATPNFMYTLQVVVDGLLIHRPNETEFASFVEDMVCIYGGVFLQLDDLATDGLAGDLAKVIESCHSFAQSAREITYCSDHLDQLLFIINSRDTLIRANSCFPYDILKEESFEKNIIKGPYESFDHYLSIHYRLLKEDFQNSLREGIIQFMSSNIRQSRNTVNHHLTIYPRVTLQVSTTKFSLRYKIIFHETQGINKFLTGALLILTPRISSSNPTPFKYYYLVRVEDSSPLERGDTHIFVSMILGPSNFIRSMDLLLAEPKQFFEPYYRVLNAVRSFDSGNVPFLRYIVEVKTDVSPPAYMKPNTRLKMGNIEFSLWDDGSWPNPEDVKLNRAQLDGLKLALRNELAIIQGPPGTGKTYLTRKIIEVLLQNRGVWYNRDEGGADLIMVVCAKNLSLDQLLGGLIKGGHKVLRVGTQSKDEALDEYNLNTLENPTHRSDRIYFQMRRMLAKDQIDVMAELMESIDVVDRLKNVQGLININILSSILHLSEVNFNYLMSHLEEWLVPSQLPVVGKMEHILSECKSWVPGVDKGDSNPVFYRVSLQDIKDQLSALQLKVDSLKVDPELKAFDTVYDLIDAVAYLERKLAAMETEFDKLNRPLTRGEQLKSLHLQNTFGLTEHQPPIEELPLEKRWLLYRIWIEDLRKFYSNQIHSLSKASQDLNLRFLEIDELLKVRKIAQCDAEVIGMTTTAAAKYYKMMDCVKPKIVVVEEAAEVMEVHTIASLSQYCEHLILVGDHKQLRPLTSSHLIGRKSHLEVSMYERLVMNGFPHCTLNTQFRMRPEIASLITPAVYPDLTNDLSVKLLPHVLGVLADLYFIDHSVEENEIPNNISRMNTHEAEFHLALCSYLVKQGYTPNQITILSVYSEQEKYFFREKSKYPNLEDVVIATVDSFQGKENDIILLSLVRSNAAGNIGFLAQQHRINVALSRAKRGLFIMGNSKNLLAKGGLWHDVVKVLSGYQRKGSTLPLKCEVHGKITLVATAKDFVPLKNGGCSKMCQVDLACGHKCVHQCHPMDRDHKDIFKCSSICDSVMDCSHSCILKCHRNNDNVKCFCKSCSPKTVCDTELPCGHTCKLMAHAEDLEHRAQFQCLELCNTILQCGHTCSSPCHFEEDIDHKKRYKCPIICEGVLFCGHQCCMKPVKKHNCSDHKTVCPLTCGFVLQCGHLCEKKCGHSADATHAKPCKRMCSQLLECGHSCKLRCHFPNSTLHGVPSRCNGCKSGQAQKTSILDLSQTSSFPGNHDKCSHGVPATSECKKRCGFVLQCSHLCKKKCRHSADATHAKPCKRMCSQLLECGHSCKLQCHFPNSTLHGVPSRCYECKSNEKSGQAQKTSILDLSQTSSFPGNHDKCSHGVPATSKCKKRCGFVLQCSHLCEKKCRHSGGATHAKLCKRMCSQLLECGHSCKLQCHFPNSTLHGVPSRCYECKSTEKSGQAQKTSILDLSQTSSFPGNMYEEIE